MSGCTILFGMVHHRGVAVRIEKRTVTVVAPGLFAAKRRFKRVFTVEALRSAHRAAVLLDVDRKEV